MHATKLIFKCLWLKNNYKRLKVGNLWLVVINTEENCNHGETVTNSEQRVLDVKPHTRTKCGRVQIYMGICMCAYVCM